MARVLKAFDCTYYDDTWTVHAATASKARYDVYNRLRDPCPDIEFSDIKVRRAPHDDITLPEPHRLVADLTASDRDIIVHAYGGGSHIAPKDWGYRDHYCTAPGDTRLLRLSWELGLFRGPYGKVDAYGDVKGWSGAFFYLSDLGKQVARSLIEVPQ